MNSLERRLVAAAQEGLPLVEEPYAQVAAQLGITEGEVIHLLELMLRAGKIRRIGIVPDHYALGFAANGMAVWDVPDDRVREIGEKMGRFREVTHCYRRPRYPPHWPYNLFAMVHGRTRQEVNAIVDRITQELGLSQVAREVIFSTRQLKKTGAHLVAKGE